MQFFSVILTYPSVAQFNRRQLSFQPLIQAFFVWEKAIFLGKIVLLEMFSNYFKWLLLFYVQIRKLSQKFEGFWKWILSLHCLLVSICKNFYALIKILNYSIQFFPTNFIVYLLQFPIFFSTKKYWRALQLQVLFSCYLKMFID